MSEALNGGTVLVTGANGFVGRALVDHLLRRHDRTVVAGVRRSDARVPTGAEIRIVPTLGPEADWANALVGVDQIVHTAARVHVMDETEADPLTAFLLRTAARDTVKRLAKAAVAS